MGWKNDLSIIILEFSKARPPSESVPGRAAPRSDTPHSRRHNILALTHANITYRAAAGSSSTIFFSSKKRKTHVLSSPLFTCGICSSVGRVYVERKKKNVLASCCGDFLSVEGRRQATRPPPQLRDGLFIPPKACTTTSLFPPLLQENGSAYSLAREGTSLCRARQVLRTIRSQMSLGRCCTKERFTRLLFADRQTLLHYTPTFGCSKCLPSPRTSSLVRVFCLSNFCRRGAFHALKKLRASCVASPRFWPSCMSACRPSARTEREQKKENFAHCAHPKSRREFRVGHCMRLSEPPGPHLTI